MRIKHVLSLLLASVLLGGFVSLIQARPSRSFKLPSQALKVAEDVYYLGKTAEGAEGYAFLYRKGEARTAAATLKAPKCYGFLAKGARWKTTEPYVTDIFSSATETSLETWDSQVVAFDIFGPQGTTPETLSADTSAPDGQNELYFGDIAKSNVIGVTIVWGISPLRPRTGS